MTAPPTVRILLVEDDADDEERVRTQMNDAVDGNFTFQMTRAPLLRVALEHLKSEVFDVVLLDLKLPDSIGLGTLTSVLDVHRGIPVLVLTGFGDTGLGVKAVSLGAQDYLVKGTLSARDLKRAIRYAVERARLLTQIEEVLQAAPDGMVVLDSAGIVRFVNAAAVSIFRQDAASMLGAPFLWPATPNKTTDLILPGEGGARRHVEMRVSRMEWNGRPATLATLRDVTELKKLEELRHAIKSHTYQYQHR